MIKTEKLVKALRRICKERNVQMRLRNLDDANGLCYLTGKKRVIDINKKIREKAELARTVFHELAHAECIERGKYMSFHREHKLPPSKIFYYENKVERLAKRNWDKLGMRKMFGQYQYYYSIKNKKEVLKWIREGY